MTNKKITKVITAIIAVVAFALIITAVIIIYKYYMCYNTIPCCCPVAVDIHDLFYLNTTRFGNANHISAACQHSEMKWDRGDVSTNRALSSMHQSLTPPLKQLKSKELALF